MIVLTRINELHAAGRHQFNWDTKIKHRDSWLVPLAARPGSGPISAERGGEDRPLINTDRRRRSPLRSARRSLG
jgi:hypothetical protein